MASETLGSLWLVCALRKQPANRTQKRGAAYMSAIQRLLACILWSHLYQQLFSFSFIYFRLFFMKERERRWKWRREQSPPSPRYLFNLLDWREKRDGVLVLVDPPAGLPVTLNLIVTLSLDLSPLFSISPSVLHLAPPQQQLHVWSFPSWRLQQARNRPAASKQARSIPLILLLSSYISRVLLWLTPRPSHASI